MRTVKHLTWRPDEWVSVPIAFAVGFFGGLAIRMLFFNELFSSAVLLALASGSGCALGAAFRVLVLRKPRRAARPLQAPPPGRAD